MFIRGYGEIGKRIKNFLDLSLPILYTGYMESITQLILNKLSKPYGYIAKAKHGKSPEILLGDLVFAIISFNSARETRDYLGIAEQTFNRTVKRCFPEITLRGGGQTWSHFLLNSVGYKRCFTCGLTKCLDSFLREGSCKACRHIYNTSDARKTKNREHQKKYYYANLDYCKEKTTRYKEHVAIACPPWVSTDALRVIYANRPDNCHVDHIIPLQGKYICGLHVPWNLQYLPISENCSKGNYHISEEYWK